MSSLARGSARTKVCYSQRIITIIVSVYQWQLGGGPGRDGAQLSPNKQTSLPDTLQQQPRLLLAQRLEPCASNGSQLLSQRLSQRGVKPTFVGPKKKAERKLFYALVFASLSLSPLPLYLTPAHPTAPRRSRVVHASVAFFTQH